MKYPCPSSSHSPSNVQTPFLFSYQKPAFHELCCIAHAFARTESWQNLSIRPRWHRLVVGPTGTGKTHLATALAQELGWPLLSLTMPDWILMGCTERGARQTWRQVAEWLAKRNSFSLIFIDEIDKVGGSDTWSRHLRTEVFDLLDGRVPPGLRINDDGEEDAETSAQLRLRVAIQLASKTLILGASAFQEAWEDRSRASIGFGEHQHSPPVLSKLTAHLQRELLNRFASRLILLPSLERTDYREMLLQTARHLPLTLRARFSEVGRQRLEEGHRDQKGARFIEETLSECLLISVGHHHQPSPEH